MADEQEPSLWVWPEGGYQFLVDSAEVSYSTRTGLPYIRMRTTEKPKFPMLFIGRMDYSALWLKQYKAPPDPPSKAQEVSWLKGMTLPVKLEYVTCLDGVPRQQLKINWNKLSSGEFNAMWAGL